MHKMKTMKNIILLLLLVISMAASAQDLKTLVPKGSKIFLQVNEQSTYKKAHDNLAKWGYWQIVDNKKDADFKLKVTMIVTGTGFNTAWADFYAKDNENVFTTRSVSLTVNLDAFETINELIHKQLKGVVE